MPNIENIIDELCIKRLLLSYNTDIDTLRELDYKKIKENSEIMNNITKKITENFCHIACIFKGQLYNKNILSIGINHYNTNHSSHFTSANHYSAQNNPTTHAEIDAIDKLRKYHNTKKPQNINILVIRVNKRCEVKMSKPCKHCIDKMFDFPLKKGYKIKKIMYSLDDKKYEKTTLEKLYSSENKHISKYHRNN